MKFRPCIDIHAGVVKQIVGSSLSPTSDESLVENFVASAPASVFAKRYQDDKLVGGHIIMLGPNCEHAALEALAAYRNGMQIGGGINVENAKRYLDAGASHVIVTSSLFENGEVSFEKLVNLTEAVGKDRLVIDLSCRKRAGDASGLYYVVTDKWTKYTSLALTRENLVKLSDYCAEFLVHGVDVEGKRCGIEDELVSLLGDHCPLPVTYAGGVRSIDDLELVLRLGRGRVDCTVGSALDMFGGDLPYTDVLAWHHAQQHEASGISGSGAVPS